MKRWRHCRGLDENSGVKIIGNVLFLYSDSLGLLTTSHVIIGHTKRESTAVFSVIKNESTEMDLAVDEGKTKFIKVEIWAGVL